MKRIFLLLILNLLIAGYGRAQKSCLQRRGNATQLIINDTPYLILGGELGNSSAANTQDIERIFPKLQKMGLNTVLVPAYWDLLEPVEGDFDFTLTDKVLEQARKYNLKVVFLWFGAWKNSTSCYAPLWFKENDKKYPRAHTESGKPLEIASAFSDEVLQADQRAFTQWLKHIAAADRDEGTVIMIQIENEIGMLEDARDYSPEANSAFCAPIPQELASYLQKHKKDLHPRLLKKWEAQGCKREGNWQEVFGADIYTDEIGQLLDLEAQKFTHKYGKELGVHMDLRLVPFTSHVPFGKVIGATPNGRFSYTPLSDGSSASQGADLNGPTAVLLSNYKTKNFDYEDHAARLLNIKLSPSCVEGENGTEKLVQFIKAWHDLRLWHLQFNVLNTETLRQAQKQPQLYKNLLVRIAGYSAYFTELSKDLQDDIIARTEHEEVS